VNWPALRQLVRGDAGRFAVIWAGHLLLLIGFFWWTGTSDSTGSRLLWSAAAGGGLLVIGVALEGWVFRDAQRAALRRRTFWLSVLFVAASLATGRLIVNWVPNVAGLGWQLLSFTLRFGLAWTLVSAAWWNLARQAALPPADDSGLSVIPH
jgi:hypothetical protein